MDTIAPTSSTDWCKTMSFLVNNPSRVPLWFVLIALFALAGCVDEGDIGVPGGGSDSVEESDENVVPGGDPGEQEEVPGDDTGTVPGGDPAPEPEPEVEDYARLSWQAPTHRENGEGLYLGEINEYVISYGNDPDALDLSVTVSSDGTLYMEHIIEDLDAGDWFFTIQTVDHDGNISAKAEVVSKAI